MNPNPNGSTSSPLMIASLTPEVIEEKTLKIARQLLAATTTNRSIFSKLRDQLRWDEKLLNWTMDNPKLRVQLFRLIDCLPALTTKTEIARHLQEYLSDAAVELPSALKNLLNFTRTPSHIDRAKLGFEVGNLYINRSITGAIVARQPFGGYKLSGVGSKAGGPDYLLQFLDPRTVTENVQRQGFAPIEGIE